MNSFFPAIFVSTSLLEKDDIFPSTSLSKKNDNDATDEPDQIINSKDDIRDLDQTIRANKSDSCETRGSKVKWERAADGVNAANQIRLSDELDALDDMIDRIHEINDTYGAASKESIAGRIAEEYHTGTFNLDAVRKGRSGIMARTTESLGEPHAPADMKVFQDEKTVAEAQSKYRGSTAKTTFGLSDPKYDGMQKIHPADQDVAGLAQKRGSSGVGARNYPDTARNANPTLKYDKVSSESLSRKGALDIAKNPQKATQSIMKDQVMTSVKADATRSALIGGIISAGQNVKAVRDGHKNLKVAMLDTAKDTVTSGIDSGVKSAATVAIKEGLKRAGARSFARGSGPAAIAMTGVDLAKDVGSYAAGDIDGEELVVRSGKTVIRGAGTWGGAKAGAAIGTAIWPGGGTIIGGMVGGIAAGIGLSSLWS